MPSSYGDLRGVVAALAGAAVVGCAAAGPPGPVAMIPEPAPEVHDGLPEAANDSLDNPAADNAVLDALREMEFGSLGKNASHVYGVVTFPDSSALEQGLALASEGGPASAMPSYDIDVVSFGAHQRVRYYMEYFQGPARERFNIWLGRLPRFEGMIRARFRARGVPEDLVYLALIESGYSSTAVSRANAVGMWQFIRGTGQRYGLRIDTWVDERRDPFKATEAAAAYLADLNDQFGSWYLAAAAYNGGSGRVTRGIRRLRVDSLSDETFFDLSDRRYLRSETRDYVPKLIAAALLAKSPTAYGFDPDSIPEYPPYVFDEVTVPDATGLDVIAGLADTTVAAIVDLNTHYVRGVTPPNERAVVRVPRGTGARVIEQYAALPPSDRVNFLEHVVRGGETLSEIGERYGVSVSLLRSANGNIDPARLRIGRRLVVPVSKAARVRATSGAAPRPTSAVTGVRVHVVRSGDTLWGLAQRYGVRVSDLRGWNDLLEDDVLRVGQRLQVTARSR